MDTTQSILDETPDHMTIKMKPPTVVLRDQESPPSFVTVAAHDAIWCSFKILLQEFSRGQKQKNLTCECSVVENIRWTLAQARG